MQKKVVAELLLIYYLYCFQITIFYFCIMFVCVKKSPNSPNKAVQIIESLRQDNKVRQRILRHVSTALNDKELKGMQDRAEHGKELIRTIYQSITWLISNL